MSAPLYRRHRVYSIAVELVRKSREAALTAVQAYNNPMILFKSETFIVLMVIAWTYLLHAYYRQSRIEYRYFRVAAGRRRYDRTKASAYKYWELERCLDCDESPIDRNSANNLRFLIGLRNEIEHQMTSSIDRYIEAKLQACCLNYNYYLKLLFGDRYALDGAQPYSLQLSSLAREQSDELLEQESLPRHIRMFVEGFDGRLSEEEYNSPRFAYRVLFTARTANHPGQADEVIRFVKADSAEARAINPKYALIRETERQKYLPGDIVRKMQDAGFTWFNMYVHTCLWKEREAKSPTKGFGAVVGKTWYWYEGWLAQVEAYCRAKGSA